jgi:molybdate-binding protein
VPPGTDYLAEGEPVDVTLFSPAVRPPTLLGMGEDDPLLSRLLDTVSRPRYLPLGSTEGRRRLGNSVPDIAVVAGPAADDHEATDIGGWQREWGLIVGPDTDVSDLGDLVDGDYRFVNRDTASGLRRSFDDVLDAFGGERGVGRAELVDAIDGYELTTKAYESPARKVLAGDADAGLGLRATATKLDLGFVALGTQPVRVLANPERQEKDSVTELAETLADLGSLAEGLVGIGPQ